MNNHDELDALMKAVERRQQVEQVENFLRNHLQSPKLEEFERAIYQRKEKEIPISVDLIEQETTKRIEWIEVFMNMDMSKLLEMALEASITNESEKENLKQKDRFIDDRDRGL